MFRKMLRHKQQLSNEECISLLKKELRGVLSVLGDEDYPYGMPLNHYYCEEDGKIYFHSGMVGHKMDSLKKHDKVSYCVYNQGVPQEGHIGLLVQSVIVFGRIEFIEDQERIFDLSRKLSHKFTSDDEYIENEIKRVGKNTAMFAIIPEYMTGKWVEEE